MSVKLMSAIFETEFPEYMIDGEGEKTRASTIKLVLLAIADHANDEGESAYPGLTRLERKTGLSRQGLVNTLKVLKHNGLISVSEEKSKLGTNNYTINCNSFPCLVNPVDYPSQPSLPPLVNPVDSNHPLTTIKPPIEEDGAKIQKDAGLENLIKEFEHFHGTISIPEMHLLGELLDDWRNHMAKHPEHPDTARAASDVVMDAVKITAANAENRRSLAYTGRIIQSWIENGYGWKPANNKYPIGKKAPGNIKGAKNGNHSQQGNSEPSEDDISHAYASLKGKTNGV